MKAELKFNLPEEKEEFEAAVSAMKTKIKLDYLYENVFRKYIKYEKPIFDNELSKEQYEVINKIWQEVYEYLYEDA